MIDLRPLQDVPDHERVGFSLVNCAQGRLIKHDEGSLNERNCLIRFGLRHNRLEGAVDPKHKCQRLGGCAYGLPLSCCCGLRSRAIFKRLAQLLNQWTLENIKMSQPTGPFTGEPLTRRVRHTLSFGGSASRQHLSGNAGFELYRLHWDDKSVRTRKHSNVAGRLGQHDVILHALVGDVDPCERVNLIL